jgi:geranylgeranyl pyrophosphate synthase
MNDELIRNADPCYHAAEQKAAQYFQALCEYVKEKTYAPELIKDFQFWKQDHIHHSLFLSLFHGKRKTEEYGNYLKWLNDKGKLDQYLERSISYIYLRDLGKDLDSLETQTKVRRMVRKIRDGMFSTETAGRANPVIFNMAWLYRKAQKLGIESTMIWLTDRFRKISANIPAAMDTVNAQRKLIKIIAGVIMHEEDDFEEETVTQERSRKLDEVIRLGYYYGLTYPFIDDLFDADLLSKEEKRNFSDLIRTSLATGTVPDIGEWTGNNRDFILFIYGELKEAFEYIQSHQRLETRTIFYEQSYVFFHSQEVDRTKELSNEKYTNEELYIPIILKSASSRLIVRSLLSAPMDIDFNKRAFFYGIYNQLADDFADMFDDMKAGAVTPFTYYLKYHHKRSDLINPFELYWTVIFNLIHNVYHSDTKTCEVILDRAINGLKRYKENLGKKKYNEVMNLFALPDPKLNHVIQNMVRLAEDVDFYDKLLRDQFILNLGNEQREKEEFSNMVEKVRLEINDTLTISDSKNEPLINEPITAAANYSLRGDGKRLRPIMTWMLGVKGYKLKSTSIVPLLKSLEYMHTASLIFDDLPSQDNAPFRRGRKTVHREFDTAIAELTGLFLTQKATEELTSLDQFESKTVLKLINYCSRVTQVMCKGQAIDLASKGKKLTLEQLNEISFNKTGIGFEACVVMPAMLGGAEEKEIESLKAYAYHGGIAFQIKDDLLDVEGETHLLGKQTGKDAENNNSTFVSVLGIEQAKKEMWTHYCFAFEALQNVPRNTNFLRYLLNYFVSRDH